MEKVHIPNHLIVMGLIYMIVITQI